MKNKNTPRLIFPWLARCNGGFFFALGIEIVKICPFCGHNGKAEGEEGYADAFQSGHVRRIWGEEVGLK